MIGNITTIATWLAGLTFTDVTVVDAYSIPDAVNPQDCPIMMPDVNAPFMQDFEFTRLSLRDSVGGRSHMAKYKLNYVYYHSVVTEGVTLFETYGAMIDAWQSVINVLVVSEDPTGAYDIRPEGTPQFGSVRHDVTGQLFHGCRFQLAVQEFSS